MIENNPSKDPLVNKFYNLGFNGEWFFGMLEELGKVWKEEERDSETFDLFIKKVGDQIKIVDKHFRFASSLLYAKNLYKLGEKLEEHKNERWVWKEATAIIHDIRETMDFLLLNLEKITDEEQKYLIRNIQKVLDNLKNAKTPEKVLNIVKGTYNKIVNVWKSYLNTLPVDYDIVEKDMPFQEFIEALRKILWDEYFEYFSAYRTYQEHITSISIEYNERIEEAQASTLIEPRLRVMVRSGSKPTLTEALNKLMKDYVPQSKKQHYSWKGIVTMGTMWDYHIDSRFMILTLPTDIKLETHNKLPVLAHEGGHFVLAKDGEIGSIKKDFGRTVSRTFRESGQEFNENKQEELFCDLYAGLVAGPFFYRSLMANIYYPYFLDKKLMNAGTHPESYIRRILGEVVSKKMNAGKWSKATDKTLQRYKIYFEKTIDSHEELLQIEKIKEGVEKAVNDTYDSLLKKLREYKVAFFPEDKTSEEIYNGCLKIAKKLSWYEEIELHAPPKYIVAASLISEYKIEGEKSPLPLLKRPYFPTGRVYHSLYHTESNYKKFYEEYCQ